MILPRSRLADIVPIDVMQCSECGGRVEWRGPLSNLTHTQCVQCGALSSQEPEPADDEENDDGQ